MSVEDRGVVRVEPVMAAIPAEAWNAVANPDAATANPFLAHAFLAALEQSGCVTAETGWLPQHLVLEDADGGIAAAMPCYLKSHSRGEYVFDYGWADAFERAGGRYYPKLQAAIPFTPVTGRRLLLPDTADAEMREQMLVSAAIQLCERHGASSLHATFVTEGEWRRLGELGLLQRTDQQFHWRNEGYRDFEDFLGTLTSRKRKAVRRERREAMEDGIEVEWITGGALTEAHWDAFYRFYIDTGRRKWGTPYLNRTFFSLLGEAMADNVLLIMCRRAGEYIAGALNMIGGHTLYGRYWGAIEHHRCLHFEACYYQAMEYAIEHGLTRVEAGAQGEHKLARGYLPETTYSVHHIADPQLRSAVASYLRRERQYVEMETELMREHTPFRKTD